MDLTAFWSGSRSALVAPGRLAVPLTIPGTGSATMDPKELGQGMTRVTKGKFPFFAGVFIITGSTLMLQIVMTRILSVTSWYYLAFFIVGMAMFGLSAGGVWVYLRRDYFTKRYLCFDLVRYTAAFGCSSVVSLLVLVTLTPGLGGWLIDNPATAEIVNFLVWLAIAGCLALPFFFSGVAVSLALTRSPFRVSIVYAVDLIGAAIGCLAVLVLMTNVDAPSAILWIGCLSMVAALAFKHAAIGDERDTKPRFHRLLGNPGTLVIFMIALASANTLGGGFIRPILVKDHMEIGPATPESIAWNSYSRVTARRASRGPAALWGASPRFDPSAWEIEQRWHQMDGLAGTVAYRLPGGLSDAGFLRYDVSSIAYVLEDLTQGAVIGIGGGRDLLAARYFGLDTVTGVEINPLIIDLLFADTEIAEFAGIRHLTGLEIVNDEARSWFSRTDRQFDLVQMSLIDTWAATGAGAFSLSENGLYTLEAWETFVSRLSPVGAFTVSRYFTPEFVNETGRLVSLAMATGFRSGFSDPRAHIFVAAAGNVATLVLTRNPLNAANLARLEGLAAEMEFDILLTPSARPEAPVLNQIVSATSAAELDRITRFFELDLTPSTDNRPFFFNSLPFWDATGVIALASTDVSKGNVVRGNLAATKTLLELLFLSIGLVLVCLILPLRKALLDMPGKFVVGSTSYFFLIGFGFMLAEIALMQRLSVFLGHPVYSLSIVLFSIILTTGLGSGLSDRLQLDSRLKITLWSAATALYLYAISHFMPNVIALYIGEDLILRALVSVALISPLGILMGFGFPTGMRLATQVSEKPTPWLWGVNGAAGVLASVIAIMISIAYGIDTTMMVAAACYAVLPLSAALCSRQHPGTLTGPERRESLEQTA